MLAMSASVNNHQDHGDLEVSTDEFEQAVKDLVTSSQESVKSRSQPIKETVNSITAYTSQRGVPALTLSTIIDVITRSTTLDQTSVSALLDYLYPAGKVPAQTIYIVVNAIGQGRQKPSPTIQNRLLRWIILVLDVVEEASILESLYSVLFNLLDMISIRPYLCHLLAIITKKKHVKPYRIQLLLELIKNAGCDSALLGVLHVYKKYYPDITAIQIASKYARFTHPDPEWRDRLWVIQDSNIRPSEETHTSPSTFKVVRKGAKRSRVTIVPEIHTYRADKSSITLEEINGVDDFVENLDRIDPPNQMVSVIDDPLLQHYTMLAGNTVFKTRLEHWLALFFDTQLQVIEDSGHTTRILVDMLEKILGYARRAKFLPDSAESFLKAYLDRWDGQEHQLLILNLLALLPLTSFAELYSKVLSRLEGRILDNTPKSATTVLDFYTDLLRHWTVLLLVAPQEGAPPTLSQVSTIAPLAAHASLLSLSILASYQPSQLIISSVLSYHETLAHTISHAPTHPQIHILTPRTQTIYLLAFLFPTICSLSRLCSVLAIYKRAFETAMAQSTPSPTPEYPRNYVNGFNGFLMDICNMLWRSRAFNTTDTNALGCMLPASILPHLNSFLQSLAPPQALSSLFSLSHHQALCAVSIAAFRELEDKAIEDGEEHGIEMRHAGPVTQRSLAVLGADGGLEIGWAEYRLEVLKWLEGMGADGVRELMFCTMKHLIGKEKG